MPSLHALAPGPWSRSFVDGKVCVVDSDGAEVACCGPFGSDRNQAIARLIMCAPELLDAAIEASAVIGVGDSLDQEMRAVRLISSAVEKAISNTEVATLTKAAVLRVKNQR